MKSAYTHGKNVLKTGAGIAILLLLASCGAGDWPNLADPLPDASARDVAKQGLVFPPAPPRASNSRVTLADIEADARQLTKVMADTRKQQLDMATWLKAQVAASRLSERLILWRTALDARNAPGGENSGTSASDEAVYLRFTQQAAQARIWLADNKPR